MSTPSTSNAPRRDRRFLLVPAITFLLGLVLGGVLIGVANLGPDGADGTGEAAPAPATSSATPTDDVTVTVPRPCVDVAERSEEVLDLVQRAAAAVGDLNARELGTIVDEMQALEPEVRENAAACQELATAPS